LANVLGAVGRVVAFVQVEVHVSLGSLYTALTLGSEKNKINAKFENSKQFLFLVVVRPAPQFVCCFSFLRLIE